MGLPWCAPLRRAAVLLWLLLAVALPRAAGAAGVDVDAIGPAPLSLTPHMAVLEDPGGQLTLDEVLQPEQARRFAATAASAEAFNFGITGSAYWFRITLNNPQVQPLQRLLEVGYARLSHVTLHRPAPGGGWHTVVTGATEPFESRPWPHRFFVFALALPGASTQTLYLRVQSTTAFIVPARLWVPEAFHAHERNDYFTQAWYFGMATAMILFNLLLFVRLRDRVYIDYVVFALAMAFALAAQNGLVKEFVRPGDPRVSDLLSTFGYSWTIAAALQFVRHMLDTALTQPRWDRWLWRLVLFFSFSPAAFLVSTGPALIRAAAVVDLGAVLVAVVVGLRGVLRRQRSAYFFVGAFLLLALGAMTNALRAMGLAPTNLLTIHAMQAGSALEMLLLAFALADRFNEIRREKAGIQKKLLDAQQTLIESLRQSEQVLEQRVQARTQALQALNQQLAALSLTDSLTGIANRRRFDEVLAAEWQRAQRSGQPLTLAMVDVDWFKRYNDHYGHLAGDECLRRIAQVLADHPGRPSDLVARYGGEEFAILAPATNGAGMLEIARRIQGTLSGQGLAHAPSPLGLVTVSIGVACMVPGPGDTPQTLVRRADEALYQAKAQGRNRVEIDAG